MEKSALSFRVEEPLKKRLIALAEADRRPLSQYLTLVLTAHVEAVAKRTEAKRKPKG